MNWFFDLHNLYAYEPLIYKGKHGQFQGFFNTLDVESEAIRSNAAANKPAII